MTKFKKEDIERIINNLGGVKNILNVRSCATRAKITVVDMKYVNNDALDVETTVIKGHFCTDNNVVQLIIGTDRIPSFITLMNQVMEESMVSVGSKQEQNPNQPHDQKIINPFAAFLMEVMKEAEVSFEDPTKAQNHSPDDEVTLTKKDVAIIQLNINGIIANFRSIQEVLNKYR